MHRTVIAALALVAAVAAVTTAATVAAPAASAPRATAGSLDFKAVLPLFPTSVPCPADVPPTTTECHALTLWEVGSVDGLGRVTEATYTLPVEIGPPTCPAGLGKPLATSGRLLVAGRGEITFTLAGGERCAVVRFDDLPEPDGFGPIEMMQEFTVTGGTGQFAAASGSGQVERAMIAGYLETWTGTLTAPGLHPNLPTLTGAVAKTVRAAKRAKSARVTFEVTATDDGGGGIPVSCHPSSGSRFPLGTTNVLCAATDANGNTATAEFTVTVKRGR